MRPKQSKHPWSLWLIGIRDRVSRAQPTGWFIFTVCVYLTVPTWHMFSHLWGLDHIQIGVRQPLLLAFFKIFLAELCKAALVLWNSGPLLSIITWTWWSYGKFRTLLTKPCLPAEGWLLLIYLLRESHMASSQRVSKDSWINRWNWWWFWHLSLLCLITPEQWGGGKCPQ